MNPPTAGRIVHYYSPDEEVGHGPRAAIVNRNTGPDGYAELTVFCETWQQTVKASYSEEPQQGCWSWMPYQKAKAETAEGNQSESAEPRPSG